MRKPEVFRSERIIPIAVPDLTPVAEDVMKHFRDKGFEVAGGSLASGAWEISIRRGGWVKAGLGTKLALNITIKPEDKATHVQAGAGIFGHSVVPAAISWYVTWPTALTRGWGLIRQAKLDGEAIAVAESSLSRQKSAEPAGTAGDPHAFRNEPAGARVRAVNSCSACNRDLYEEADFCPGCGTRVA